MQPSNHCSLPHFPPSKCSHSSHLCISIMSKFLTTAFCSNPLELIQPNPYFFPLALESTYCAMRMASALAATTKKESLL